MRFTNSFSLVLLPLLLVMPTDAEDFYRFFGGLDPYTKNPVWSLVFTYNLNYTRLTFNMTTNGEFDFGYYFMDWFNNSNVDPFTQDEFHVESTNDEHHFGGNVVLSKPYNNEYVILFRSADNTTQGPWTLSGDISIDGKYANISNTVAVDYLAPAATLQGVVPSQGILEWIFSIEPDGTDWYQLSYQFHQFGYNFTGSSLSDDMFLKYPNIFQSFELEPVVHGTIREAAGFTDDVQFTLSATYEPNPSTPVYVLTATMTVGNRFQFLTATATAFTESSIEPSTEPSSEFSTASSIESSTESTESFATTESFDESSIDSSASSTESASSQSSRSESETSSTDTSNTETSSTESSSSESFSSSSSSQNNLPTGLIVSYEFRDGYPVITIEVPGALGPWTEAELSLGVAGPFSFTGVSGSVGGEPLALVDTDVVQTSLDALIPAVATNASAIVTISAVFNALGTASIEGVVSITTPNLRLKRRAIVEYPDFLSIEPNEDTIIVPLSSSSSSTTASTSSGNSVSSTGTSSISTSSSVTPPNAATSTATKSDIKTTVITTTSCNDNKCTPTLITTGLTVITSTANGVVTTYTTYCPLTESTTETHKTTNPSQVSSSSHAVSTTVTTTPPPSHAPTTPVEISSKSTSTTVQIHSFQGIADRLSVGFTFASFLLSIMMV